MEEVYKEVYFNEYCNSCMYKDTKEADEPCAECLCYPANTYSHKPINYEENKNNEEKKQNAYLHESHE